MRRIIFALLLLPQIVQAQYREGVFSLDSKNIPVEHKSIGQIIQKDTVIELGMRGNIYGLSVTGTAILDNNIDSYVRVILRDDHNYEHLVYECHPMLTETLTPQFRNTAIETRSLDGIRPHSIRVELLNARIFLDSLSYAPESEAAKRSVVNSAVVQKEQSRHIVDMLNKNLAANNMTWRAGVTSMAEKSFEEKKGMFGGTMPQLYGFDYYAGGIFVIPDSETYSQGRMQTEVPANPPTYVSNWDWRNRHGRNWITSVKDQGNCGSCYAFATTAALESYVNLYYNHLYNMNLSEQEIVSCSNNNGCIKGGLGKCFKYIKQNGLVNEDCFKYLHNNYNRPCGDRCSPPLERIGIEDYDSFNVNSTILKALYEKPLAFGITRWKHLMLLAGYKTVALGDKIYLGTDSTGYNQYITVDTLQYGGLIDQRAWFFKNSWGTDWGLQGFGYAIANIGIVNMPFSPKGRVTSMRYDDSNIICEDRDGDGYYFWGLEDKPSFVPIWVPDSIDGADNNYQKGKLLLENTPVIGELETINPNGISTLTINSNTTYTTRQYKRTHIVVASNKTLTVKNILNMFGRPTITIQSGGHLVIDGGVITNANISMVSGSKLTIKNGGKLVMRTNTSFNAPTGAIVEMTNGEILRSNDF